MDGMVGLHCARDKDEMVVLTGMGMLGGARRAAESKGCGAG